MKYDPDKHHRRSIRLKGYDYTQAGAYFVTVVAYQRECLFGEMVGDDVVLNDYGWVVEKWWHNISVRFPNVETQTFIIMPNHIHGVIFITEDGRGAVSAPENEIQNQSDASQTGRGTLNQGEMTSPLRRPTLGQIVAYFKYQSTKEMNAMGGTGTITKFWQRNYYERIIRDEREMDRIHRYIESNPSMWADDDENPANV